MFFFPDPRTDTPAEIDLVCQIAKECGASDAVSCQHWSQGGRGSLELARAVKEAARQPTNFQFLYNTEVGRGFVGIDLHVWVFLLMVADSVTELFSENTVFCLQQRCVKVK